METPQNLTQNTEEFAKKDPLVYKRTIIKYLLFGLVGILLLGITVAAFYFYNLLNQPKPPEPTPPPPEQSEKPPVSDEPEIAYIKDNKAIWKIKTDGKDKEKLLEISPTSQEVFSSIAWKDKTKLTYSKCLEDECFVETYDLQTKGVGSEVNQKLDFVQNLVWSPNKQYLIFVNTKQSGEATNLVEYKIKAGNQIATLESIESDSKDIEHDSKIAFSKDSAYIITSGNQRLLKNTSDTYKKEYYYETFVHVFQPNGTKVDEIKKASDPMVKGNSQFAYLKDSSIYTKSIGGTDESLLTTTEGKNGNVSPSEVSYALWKSSASYSNAVLLIFDVNKTFTRNILRGVLFPQWTSEIKVVGIRAGDCLGGICQLYEYQSNVLSVIDITNGTAIDLDQGRKVSSIVLNTWNAN